MVLWSQKSGDIAIVSKKNVYMSTNTVVRDLVVEMLSTHRYEFVPMYRYNGNKMSIHRYEFVPTCRYNGTKKCRYIGTNLYPMYRQIFVPIYRQYFQLFYNLYDSLTSPTIGLSTHRVVPKYRQTAVSTCRYNGTNLST